MSEAEAENFWQRLEKFESDYPEGFNATQRNNVHFIFCFFDEIAYNEIILNAVEDLIGPNILLSGSVLFIKEAYSSSFVSWHQDATNLGFSRHDFITLWLALTASNVESGCMKFMPGSHSEQALEHQDSFVEDNILTRGQ